MTEKTQPTTALARIEHALPVQNMQELATAGQLLAQSGMFGQINAAAGFVVAATCHQQGITLLEFQRTYHVVEGRPSMRADAMLAAFKERGGTYVIRERSDRRAAVTATYEGAESEWEFTWEEAERRKLCYNSKGKVKDNWEKNPKQMLWARLVSDMVGTLEPRIKAGLYTPEEVGDFDEIPRRAPGAAPQPLTQDEVERRVAAAKAVQYDESVDNSTINDYTRCPIGGPEWEGKPWTEFTDDELQAALESDQLDDDYKDDIRFVQKERLPQQGEPTQ